MSPWWHLALIWALAGVTMSLGWWWQYRHRNAGIADVLWAAALGAGAVWFAVVGTGAPLPRITLAVLGSLWGARLAWYLWRRVRHEPEDGRYHHLRTHWQDHQGKFFAFFQAQAVLVASFCLPFLAVAGNPEAAPTPWWWAGIVVWCVSVAGESMADRQLARFRSRPGTRGLTCRQGLWRYSRHPNYFFEWLHWFAYVFLAIGAPHAWLALLGPLLMYVFLRWLSGIPYTEAQALRTRGDDYRQYQRTTPMLFPWFPKSDPSRSDR